MKNLIIKILVFLKIYEDWGFTITKRIKNVDDRTRTFG